MCDSDKIRKKVELLAPAGNREAFYGAVHAGADAVYLGGEKFGARAYADNFSVEELTACIRYGHIHGCRSYLTVNTLMKERELSELAEMLTPLYQAGLDGVIVQDIGALQMIRQSFPELELHASTQMAVTGPEGALLLKDLGVTRVVPARELSLREMIKIKEESGLEVETFIHGAMCYCYSGVCLFSSLLGGRSGNRGRCAQPCRQAYETDVPGASVHRKEYYPLSLKDMCTIEHLPELIEVGIDSFKIEGRMKKPEYAAGVTAVYRKYIDRCLNVPRGNSQDVFRVEEQDLQMLSKLYIRSRRQDGYLFRHNGREMVTLDSPSYAGSDESCLEQIRQKYIREKKRIEIWMEADFSSNAPARLRMGTENCRTEAVGDMVEPAQNRPVLEEDIRKQLQKLGESSFDAESIEIRTDEKGFYSLKEINALRREAVRSLEDLIIEGHGLPVSRRAETAAFETLTGCVGEDRDIREQDRCRHETDMEETAEGRKLRIHISTEEQLLSLADHLRPRLFDRIYLESFVLTEIWSRDNASAWQDAPVQDRARQALASLRDMGITLWAALPYILRDKDYEIMEQAYDRYSRGEIQGFLVRNLEEYGWLCRHSDIAAGDRTAVQQNNAAGDQTAAQRCNAAGNRFGTRHGGVWIQLDHTVYIWNSMSATFWERQGCGLTCPLELSGREWRILRRQLRRRIEEDGDMPEKLIYGRLPMMVTANCIAKTAGKCLRSRGFRAEGTLTDRYRAKFPVEICCDVCMNVIYNSVPLSLHSDPKCCREENPRLSFTVESGRETVRIIDFFEGIMKGKPCGPPYKDYTTGHEKKGVL